MCRSMILSRWERKHQIIWDMSIHLLSKSDWIQGYEMAQSRINEIACSMAEAWSTQWDGNEQWFWYPLHMNIGICGSCRGLAAGRSASLHCSHVISVNRFIPFRQMRRGPLASKCSRAKSPSGELSCHLPRRSLKTAIASRSNPWEQILYQGRTSWISDHRIDAFRHNWESNWCLDPKSSYFCWKKRSLLQHSRTDGERRQFVVHSQPTCRLNISMLGPSWIQWVHILGTFSELLSIIHGSNWAKHHHSCFQSLVSGWKSSSFLISQESIPDFLLLLE